MKNLLSVRVKRVFALSIATLGLMTVGGCGQRMNGTYNLNQTGGMFNTYGNTSGANCSQISLNITSNSNIVSAVGSNACYTETLSGQDNGNGVMTVTLSVVQQSNQTGMNSGYQNSGSYGTSCAYQGTLTVSGSAVNGTLNPTGNCISMGSGPISIIGTKF